jgi:hypothetical protein
VELRGFEPLTSSMPWSSRVLRAVWLPFISVH